MAFATLAALGALAGEGRAQALTKETLMGRWCTDAGSYFFEPAQATVTFANGAKKVLHIKSIAVDGPKIVVAWQEDSDIATNANRGKGSHTSYSQFTGGSMVQLSEKYDDGTMSKSYTFHRC